jgi:hypothetical protein
MAIRVKQKGNVLRIELPLEKPKPSTSGKSMLVASTHGVKTTEVFCEGRRIAVNASAFIYPKKTEKQ